MQINSPLGFASNAGSGVDHNIIISTEEEILMSKAFQGFLLGSVLAAPFLGAPKAHAFQIINPQTNKCLTVPDGSTASGTPIQASPCIGTFGQQWKWEGFLIKGIGTFEDLNPLGGGFNKCVYAGFSTPRGPRPVQLADCNGAGPPGQWVYDNAFDSAGGAQIINVPADRCLDVSDGSNVTLASCIRDSNFQRWSLR